MFITLKFKLGVYPDLTLKNIEVAPYFSEVISFSYLGVTLYLTIPTNIQFFQRKLSTLTFLILSI